MMADDRNRSLRILIANERKDRLARIAKIATELGHEVIFRELEVSGIAEATQREHPDLALIGLGGDGKHALDVISQIVRNASCPVIALLEASDPVLVTEAAKRGIFGFIVDGNALAIQSTIDITLRRYADYANLQGAFARRAVIERAKGIIMASQQLDDRQAFERLRRQSGHSGRKVHEVAQAVIDSHLLLSRHKRSG
jgi:response regulator NasT